MSTYEIDDTAPDATDDSELLDCPTCGAPAEITDRFLLGGAPGPLEHVKIVCLQRHWCTLPTDMLPVAAPVHETVHSKHTW